MSVKVLARDLLKFEPAKLVLQLPPTFTLVFDDGELNTTRRRTHVTSFFWEYHKVFPKTPLKMAHHLEVVLKGRPYNSSSHTALIEAICRDVYAQYENDEPEINAITSKIAYRTSNNMMDEMMAPLAPYVTPLDVLDAISLARHPRILEATQNTVPDDRSIVKTYDIIRDVFENDVSVRQNGLVLAYRAATVNREQVLQSITRGKPTEANGKIFDIPIMTGYLNGLSKIYDFASDSRSAPKAQASAEAPLQESEYMARRLQFLVSVVERIKGNDCGTTKLVDWFVDKEVRDDNNRLQTPGGISSMAGKIIEDPDTKQLIELTGEEKHLNGRYVRMRSVLTCQNPNPHTVCRTCFGGLWRNYYNHANLGHLCCVTITEKITQNTLGTKHLVASGEGAPIRLTSFTSKFFRLLKNKTVYHLNPILKKLGLRIILNRDEAMNLIDVMKMEDISDLKVNETTRLTSVKFIYRDKGADISDIVPVEQSNREAFLTMDMVHYIRKHGWTVDETNNFQIDLKDWDFEDPIFAIPQMEISYSQHGAEVGRMIESNMNSIDERQRPDSPLSTLQELSSLVNSKLDIPLACLEVIIYASMIPSRNNHAMARNWEKAVLGVARNTIYSRSLSCAYAFQGHADFMLDPKSFFPHFRPDNNMDVFFSPEKVIEDHKRRKPA